MAKEKQSIVKKQEAPKLYNQEEQKAVEKTAGNDWNKKAIIKDRIQKRDQWMVLKEEYPELKKIQDLSQYVVVLTTSAAKKWNVPISGIDILGSKPYINKSGLLYKAQMDPRKVKSITSIPLILPIEVQESNLSSDAELSKVIFSKDGTVLMRGVVEFQDGTIYKALGTANKAYLNSTYMKMSTMQPYVIELAETRSQNRAIRLATGVGLVSTEELGEQQINYPVAGTNITEKIEKKTKKSKVQNELIERIEKAFVEKKYNKAKIMTVLRKFSINSLEEAKEEKLMAICREIGIEKYKSILAKKEEIKKKKISLLEIIEIITKLQKQLKMSTGDLDNLTKEILKGKELTLQSAEKVIEELKKRLNKKLKK